MKIDKLQELVLQSLEHEMGGVMVYQTAVTCAVNPELKKEWQKYLSETKEHVARLESICQSLGIDARRETPGRAVVRHLGSALVEAMKMALAAGDRAAAEVAACECVVLAETKDHLDWELLGKCAENLEAAKGEALMNAYQEIEDQEDEHYYHSKGWCRELWIQALGLPAVIPPPEERRKVKTAIGAARAEQAAERAR
jgi:ferritin-like metal-binding protein YciE